MASRPVAGYTSSPAKYILWDETPGGPYNPDRLYVGEVTNPLDDPVNRLTESESVDVIGLDTGFMGTVETAYQSRPESGRFGADYMVASPGKPLPSGWNYTEILKSLGDVAELQPADFAATIVEKAYLPGPSAPEYALSAYSLDAVADVKAKLDALAGALALRENANAWNYAKSVRGYASNGSRPLYNGVPIFEYFDDTRLMPNPGYPATRYLTPPSNWLQTPLFDLYGFSEKMSVRTPYTISVVSLAESLKNAVDVCVLASTGRVTRRYFNNRAWPPYMLSNGRHGLAFFFPDGDLKVQNNPSYRLQWWYTYENIFEWDGDPMMRARGSSQYPRIIQAIFSMGVWISVNPGRPKIKVRWKTGGNFWNGLMIKKRRRIDLIRVTRIPRAISNPKFPVFSKRRLPLLRQTPFLFHFSR